MPNKELQIIFIEKSKEFIKMVTPDFMKEFEKSKMNKKKLCQEI